MRRNTGVRVVAAAVLSLGVLAACSSSPDPAPKAPGRRPSTSAQWTVQPLPAASGAESEPQLAARGTEVAVVMADEQGVVRGFARDASGRFRGGTALRSGVEPLWLTGSVGDADGWLAIGSGGSKEVDGDRKLTMQPRVLRSVDGRTWKFVEATGFSGAADLTKVVDVDGTLVAAGNLRTASDPSRGGFVAAAWHSEDGRRWHEVRMPGTSGDSAVHDLVVIDGRVVAVGGAGQRGLMWVSEDAGATWKVVKPRGLPAGASLDHLAASETTVVVSGMARGGDDAKQVLARSTDGGRTWKAAAHPPPANRGEAFAFPLGGGPGERFLATGVSFIQGWNEPEVCYADIERCRQDSAETTYASDDGDRWRRVDTSGAGKGEAGELDTLTTDGDGRVYGFSWTARGPRIVSWPGDAALPAAEEPTDATSSVRLLGKGEEPKVGRRYGVPLHIHCGMEWLYLGEQPWKRTDRGDGVETGAGDPIPDDWPAAQQTIFGFATLTDADHLEYSIGGGQVIATYERAGERPPPCI